jgi:hypothetical protein
MAKKTMDKDIEKGVEKGIVKGIESTVKKYTTKSKDDKCSCTTNHSGSCFYFLGFLGAAIYYISTATGFWDGVLGFLKAIIWPVFLVFELLRFLGA